MIIKPRFIELSSPSEAGDYVVAEDNNDVSVAEASRFASSVWDSCLMFSPLQISGGCSC